MATYMTKKEMVYVDIKKKILSGDLKPGYRLHIRSIAKEYGISEIPVREAIQNLEHDRLAQVVPHAGAIVSPLSSKELNEILELRLHLESLAVYLATPHVTKKEIAELEENLAEQKEVLLQENTADFGLLNIKFHSIIYRCNLNSRLNKMIMDLRDNSKRYFAFFTSKEITEGSYEDHLAIFEAIKEGDAERAQQVMKRHKERINREIMDKWKDNLIS